MKEAPLFTDYIDEESKGNFEQVKELLSNSGINFDVDPMLVRGLDYYTKTTFEIISGKVGSQSALCGGGRYDLLIEELGGSPTPAVGFAAGMERILLACENEKSIVNPEERIDLYIIKIDNELTNKVFELALTLRRENISVEIDYLQRSIKAQMREANKLNSRYVLFVGGEEYKTGYYLLKNMESGEQQKIAFDKLNLSTIIKN
jgi:histidyl-tRNA synthetase